MSKQNQADKNVEVLPTGPETSTKLHNDIAIAGLVNAQFSIVNSERQVIWLRYNSMLIANSVAFGFLNNISSHSSFEILFGCSFGIVLCIFWELLTRDGWKFYELYCDCAQKIVWPKIDKMANPMQYQNSEFQKVSEGKNKFYSGDRIKWFAIQIIHLFILGYFVVGVYTLKSAGLIFKTSP